MEADQTEFLFKISYKKEQRTEKATIEPLLIRKNDVTLHVIFTDYFFMQKDLLLTAIRAALKGGAEIMEVYSDPNADFEIERKADNSPLTIADRRSHQAIATELASTPYPVLSEEGKQTDPAVRRSWKELWVVDPLDGTKEFIKRNGEFTVNIAFVSQGAPLAGVIYIPVKEELYFADLAFGAFKLEGIRELASGDSLDTLMDKAVRLPYAGQHEGFVVVASRSHLNEETAAFIERMQQQHPAVSTVSKGSSLKFCLVAEGNADVYPRFAPTMEWDTAAGHAIVRAAGKEVYQSATGEPLQYNKADLLNPWFIVEGKRS